MISLNGADGQVHNFPDDTPQEVISKVMSGLAPVKDKYEQAADSKIRGLEDKGVFGAVKYGNRYLHGATLGLSDDALAAVQTPMQMISQGTINPAEGYRFSKALQKAIRDKSVNDTSFMGDVAELAGGLGTGVGAAKNGLTLIKEGQSLLPRIGSAMAEGAGYGGATGFNEGDGMADRVGRGIAGATAGGALGGAIPAVGAVAKYAAAKPISNLIAARDPEGAAAAKFGSAILDSGKNINDVMREVSNANTAGVPLNVADAIGKNGQRLLYTAASAEGPGRDMVTKGLEGRQAGQGERIGNLFDEALGADRTARQAGEAFIEQARQSSKPLYDAIPEYPEQITPRVDAFLKEPVMQQALKKGVQIQRNNALANGEDLTFHSLPALHGVGSDAFNFRHYQAMKTGLDDMLEQYRDDFGNLKLDQYGRSILNMRNALDEDLKRHMFPGYGAADAAYAGPAAQNQAIDLGKQMARGGRAEDNIAAFNKLNDAQKVGARLGYADSRMARIEDTTAGTNNANKLLTPKKQAELEAMSLFQGPNAPGAPSEIERRLNWENTMNQTRNQALTGSRTAENLADQQTHGVDSRLSGALKSLISGHPIHAAGEVAGAAFQGAGNLYGGNTAAVREQLARIGLSNGNVDLADLLRQATAKGRKARQVESAVVQGLLSMGGNYVGGLQ